MENGEAIRRQHISETRLAKGIGKTLTKRCPRCKEVKDREEFGRRKNGASLSLCPPCSLEYQRERDRARYQANPEKRRMQGRVARFKRLYGITLEDYESLLVAQDRKCAICREPHTEEIWLVVDHDHDNGKVRGLLCNYCNVGIGYMRDNPELLQSAIHYLSSS